MTYAPSSLSYAPYASSPPPPLPRYSEFLAATVSMQVKLDRKTLENAFNRLDVSNTKSLTKDDLTKALGEVYSEEHIQGERDRLLRQTERERERERKRWRWRVEAREEREGKNDALAGQFVNVEGCMGIYGNGHWF